MLLNSQFASFDLTYIPESSSERIHLQAVSAMAVRVADLGGLFSPLARGASLEHTHLSLTAVLPPSRWSVPAWFAMSWARLHRWNAYSRTIAVREFTCGAGTTSAVQVQADGEWLGRTPMSVSLISDAVRLFVPPTQRFRRTKERNPQPFRSPP